MISCRADLFRHFKEHQRKVIIRYDTLTQESAAQGDFSDSGVHTEFVYTPEDGDPVKWALECVEPYKPMEYSDSNPDFPLNSHDWYTGTDTETNDDGSETRYSAFFENFTSDELTAIYYGIMTRE